MSSHSKDKINAKKQKKNIKEILMNWSNDHKLSNRNWHTIYFFEIYEQFQ